jgi:hypothetical protein
MKEFYCWRCKCLMPFLEEDEWSQVSPLLVGAMKAIRNYMKKYKCNLKTARQNCKPEAMLKFKELTGMPGVHFEIIYHHRLKDWGCKCKNCGHLLRTNRARFCAKCSWEP